MGISVYVAVIGELVLAMALVVWALWKNRRERDLDIQSSRDRTGSTGATSRLERRLGGA